MAEIRINTTGEIKLYDSDDSNYVSLKSAGTVSSDVAWTLPSADGSNGQFIKTDGSGALSFGSVSSALDDITTGDAASTLATSAGNITIDAQGNDTDIIFKGTDGSADTTFLTIDGSDAGTLIANHNLELGTDASEILFGADNEVKVIHNADKGLILKHTATADDKPVSLTLQTGETDIAQDDIIGKLDFQAPDEGTGTDAILVAAGIEAVSEGDFSSSNNATKLSFKTAASEAAAEKMSLSSTGLLTIADDLMIKDGGTIGVASTNDAMTISSGGIVTFKDDILIKDGGTIGSASDADSITIASNGAVTFSQTPVFPDGSIAVADLDIDGATDIGAAIVDADLFIVDDGAGGTNRKTTASRLKTYIGGGISNADYWTKGADQAINAQTDTTITGSWAQQTGRGGGGDEIGSGLTESSGVFTFSETGIWYVTGWFRCVKNGDTRYINLGLQVTTDGSAYNVLGFGSGKLKSHGNDAVTQVDASAVIDCTDTTSIKFKFVVTADESISIGGDSNYSQSGVIAIKLGDT